MTFVVLIQDCFKPLCEAFKPALGGKAACLRLWLKHASLTALFQHQNYTYHNFN